MFVILFPDGESDKGNDDVNTEEIRPSVTSQISSTVVTTTSAAISIPDGSDNKSDEVNDAVNRDGIVSGITSSPPVVVIIPSTDISVTNRTDNKSDEVNDAVRASEIEPGKTSLKVVIPIVTVGIVIVLLAGKCFHYTVFFSSKHTSECKCNSSRCFKPIDLFLRLVKSD